MGIDPCSKDVDLDLPHGHLADLMCELESISHANDSRFHDQCGTGNFSNLLNRRMCARTGLSTSFHSILFSYSKYAYTKQQQVPIAILMHICIHAYMYTRIRVYVYIRTYAYAHANDQCPD